MDKKLLKEISTTFGLITHDSIFKAQERNKIRRAIDPDFRKQERDKRRKYYRENSERIKKKEKERSANKGNQARRREREREKYRTDSKSRKRRLKTNRKWREKNKDKVKANEERQKKRRLAIKRKVKKQLITELGGKCQICGFSDERVLVPHHKTGSNLSKLRKASNYQFYKKYQYYLKEKDNLMLLCANCHLILHSELAKRGYPRTKLDQLTVEVHDQIVREVFG